MAVFFGGSGGASVAPSLHNVSVEDFNSANGAQSVNNGTHTTVLNDGAGAFTNTAFRLPGASPLWDVGTNRFDFTELDLGDTVDIRFALSITSTGANRVFDFGLTLAEGGSAYDLHFGHVYFKSAGTYNIERWIGIYMGDTNTRDNPASFWIQSDGAGDSLTYGGHYSRVTFRNPVFVA